MWLSGPLGTRTHKCPHNRFSLAANEERFPTVHTIYNYKPPHVQAAFSPSLLRRL